MESVEKSKYLRVKGKKIVVSDAVYQETVKQIHRTRYVARLENRCGQTNFRKCAGDCGRCPYQRPGNILPLHEFSYSRENDGKIVDPNDLEDILIKKEMWESVYRIADEAVTSGGKILRMRIEDELSLRIIADELGLSISHVEYKLKRIYTVLKRHPEIFF